MEKFYYSPKDAVRELRKRRLSGVKEEVEKWRKSKGWPESNIPSGEFGILGRQIASARYEDLVFAEMAKGVGLSPLWVEYAEDKFSLHSSYKRSLVQMIYCSGKGRSGGWRVHKEKLACVHACNGQLLTDIQTKHGLLVDYHHSLWEKFIPGALRMDMSSMYKFFGGAKHYYGAYLSTFVAHGILFEDYHGGESGKALDIFTKDIFQPAWEMIVDELGLKPLITPLPWRDGMQFYPADYNWLDHGVLDRQSIEKLII